MSEPVEELTEKEKEALRLLLAGHDAKSSARELDISHHTVNDRLRSARRKLDVTTSREAARILGEAETGTPKPLVHTPLGSAHDNATAQFPSDATESPLHKRSGWRWKGLILVSLITAVAALGTVLMMAAGSDDAEPVQPAASTANKAVSGLEARIEAARSLDEARAFLSLLDSGNAEASYATTAGELRDNQGLELWKLGVALRNNRANFATRKIVGAGGRDDEPRPGEWDREVFIFQSKDRDRTLTEYLVTQRFGSEWKVIQYDLRGLDEDEE